MSKTYFRTLNADEIECRVGICRADGVSLLLYKDARCDMNILDETVGPMNWQRSHSRDNANCTVSIYNNELGVWVSKEDTGTESNTEASKGLASDSFKRACVNWGIGRELYTAPFIWVPAKKCNIVKNQRTQKDGCKDKFTVAKIEYEAGCIKAIAIRNENTHSICFSWVAPGYVPVSKRKPAAPVEEPVIDETMPWISPDVEEGSF